MWRPRPREWAALLPILAMFFGSCAGTPGTPAPDRPNLLVIVADDLGFTDLGVFGSEIRTPHLDRLAASGLLLTNFLVAPACSPTRAMLLTGADTHRVGLGTMAGEQGENQRGVAGYEGYLTDRVPTLATRLRQRGYFTCMAGKWHLGAQPGQGPADRGFERSFALLPGGASHFADACRLAESAQPAPYREDGRPVALPADFFSSDAYTDKLLAYLGAARRSGRPFFAYAAYTAPHWPLQAPDAWLDRYAGAYDAGYDELRRRRTANAIAHGIVAADHPPGARYRFAKPWAELSPAERRREARTMECYAAMVENLDHNIGRLLDALRESGELERTCVVFFSDNGPEGNPVGNLAGIGEWVQRRFDNRLANLGRRNSYCWLSPGWARATVAPFRLFKSFPTQGGVRVPAIVAWPGRRLPDRSDAVCTVRDVVPTLLELAGGPPAPRSLLAPATDPDHVVGWELFGRRAIQQGRYKIVWLWPPYGSGRWELYDLLADPAESRDLAATQPAVLRRMVGLWDAYARRNGVVLPTRDTGYALER